MTEIQRIEIRKNIPIEQAREIAKSFLSNNNKKKYTETKNWFKFRNYAKGKFEPKQYIKKKVNKNIVLIYGRLKLKGGNEELEEDEEEEEQEQEEEQAIMPSKDIMQKIAMTSYSPESERPKYIADFKRISGTPTLVFYVHNYIIVVGIRGTADIGDLKADVLIPFSLLIKSKRYLKDLADLMTFQTAYPLSEYTYYGVGHSLGSSILDKFISLGKISEGISYNGAVELKDINNTKNHRIYNVHDPLYNTIGKYAKNVETRTNKPDSNLLQKIYHSTSLGKVERSLNAHSLSNFEGGIKK